MLTSFPAGTVRTQAGLSMDSECLDSETDLQGSLWGDPWPNQSCFLHSLALSPSGSPPHHIPGVGESCSPLGLGLGKLERAWGVVWGE